MKNIIRKYTYRIEWSEEDGCHVARCLEFPSLSAHGDTELDLVTTAPTAEQAREEKIICSGSG